MTLLTKEKQTKHKKDSDRKTPYEKIKELTNITKRIQADFENYKKRTEKDDERYISMGKILVLRNLLPVVDSFTQAKDNPDVKPLYEQLSSALKNIGLQPIKAQGLMFDPHKHECLCEEESDQDKGVVTEEVQTGYKLNDYVIRHSIVKVSKGKEVKDDNLSKNSKGKSA